MAKKPTSHIFSSKTRQMYKKIATPEYFEEHILPKLMNTGDVRTLTNPEKKSLKEYLKMKRKQIKITIETSTLDHSDAIREALNSGLTRGRFGNSAQQLFEHLMRQQQFFQQYEQDKQFNNPNSHPDNKYDYTDTKTLMKVDEKWRLLRKLAEIDPRLNYDRAWASETLHEIERMIEQNQYSYEEIEEYFVDSFQSLTAHNKDWDENLYGFYDTTGEYMDAGEFGDPEYYSWEKAYQHFHGNKKAAQERWARFQKDIKNYEASWDSMD